ncbi:hypothetical protein J6590_002826 [Homalodisca vitripennis]|nr:hypothetical protein J6590_002826 [Homalodisca vitripennis]
MVVPITLQDTPNNLSQWHQHDPLTDQCPVKGNFDVAPTTHSSLSTVLQQNPHTTACRQCWNKTRFEGDLNVTPTNSTLACRQCCNKTRSREISTQRQLTAHCSLPTVLEQNPVRGGSPGISTLPTVLQQNPVEGDLKVTLTNSTLQLADNLNPTPTNSTLACQYRHPLTGGKITGQRRGERSSRRHKKHHVVASGSTHGAGTVSTSTWAGSRPYDLPPADLISPPALLLIVHPHPTRDTDTPVTGIADLAVSTRLP